MGVEKSEVLFSESRNPFNFGVFFLFVLEIQVDPREPRDPLNMKRQL